MSSNGYQPLNQGMEPMSTEIESVSVPSPRSNGCKEDFWKSSQLWINICLFALIIIGYVSLRIEYENKYVVMNSKIADLQRSLSEIDESSKQNYAFVNTNIAAMQKQEFEFETRTSGMIGKINQNTSSMALVLDGQTHSISSLQGTLKDHSAQLVRLSNGTSNADVLDRLRETNAMVKTQLSSTKDEINRQLLSTTANVSMQLEQNNQDLLETKSEVSTHLNNTVVFMKQVVAQATSQIYAVQANVSSQIDKMSSKLGSTVQQLNDQVISAQSTIHDEVSAVQSNIEQYVAITNKQFAAENDFVKYQLAGTFTLLGCLISMWHLTSHARHYEKPEVQRRIMAVLWMVPIYSITSWLSLVWPKAEPYLSAIRDCYEAYAIYTFIAMLIAILEDGKGLAELINRITHHVREDRAALQASIDNHTQKPAIHIKPPCCCCYEYHRPTTVAAAWLYQNKLMAMQFVILKPLLAIIPTILTLSGVQAVNNVPWLVDNAVNWHSPKLYILIMENLSVAVAFYGLLTFYHGTEKDLEWCDPWPKFLCIKGVVFATFWQNIAIQFMSTMGLVDERAANQIQNLLICIEMLIASLAHFYIFPYQEWAETYKKQKEQGLKLRDTLALRDFVKDMRMMVTKGWDEQANTSWDDSPVKNGPPAMVGEPLTPAGNWTSVSAASAQALQNPVLTSASSVESFEQVAYDIEQPRQEQEPLIKLSLPPSSMKLASEDRHSAVGAERDSLITDKVPNVSYKSRRQRSGEVPLGRTSSRSSMESGSKGIANLLPGWSEFDQLIREEDGGSYGHYAAVQPDEREGMYPVGMHSNRSSTSQPLLPPQKKRFSSDEEVVKSAILQNLMDLAPEVFQQDEFVMVDDHRKSAQPPALNVPPGPSSISSGGYYSPGSNSSSSKRPATGAVLEMKTIDLSNSYQNPVRADTIGSEPNSFPDPFRSRSSSMNSEEAV